MIRILHILACGAVLAGSILDARAQGYDMEGRWVCVVQCQIQNGGAWIEGRRRGLTIYNEVRNQSRGYYADPFTIVAVDWRITGRISRDGSTLFWSNGTRWIR